MLFFSRPFSGCTTNTLLRTTATTASSARLVIPASRTSQWSARRPHHREAMKTRSFPALFVRGGTSNGLVVLRRDLPPEHRWHEVLPSAMGSPDSYGRQLDGMGGGISSTSKICVLSTSERPDADVDFTFVQVGVKDGVLDVAGNCGNMSSAVGPVAWDEGLVRDRGDKIVPSLLSDGGGRGDYSEASVRIFNTNTNKIIHSRFRVSGRDNEAQYHHKYRPDGDYAMDGVPGTQSRIMLSFLDPAGAKTGRALPTGNPVDELRLPDGTAISASLVDVSNPGVFILGKDLLGLDGSGSSRASGNTLTPQAVETDPALKVRLEAIRRAGAARMGLDPGVESVPKVVVLFPSGGTRQGVDGADVDIQCLAMSMGQAHKAVPLTLALCLGAAVNIPGTLAAGLVGDGRGRAGRNGTSVVIGHPSGKVEIGTTVDAEGRVVSAELHRTARVLMKGEVFY